ncbi:hypothetical protein C8J56DRAFT_912704, partial [Mycena floridula]
MLRNLVVLWVGLIQLRGLAALQLSVSEPVVFGQGAAFQWNAVVTDPLSFSMQVGPSGQADIQFQTVTRSAEELQGTGTAPATAPGSYRLSAISVNSGEILAFTNFVAPAGSNSSSTTSSTLTSTTSQQTKESSSTTGETTTKVSTTSEDDTQSPTSTPNPKTENPNSHHGSSTVGPVGFTASSQIIPSSTSEAAGTGNASISDSTAVPSSGSKVNIPVIVGSVVGGILAVLLIMTGGICLLRRARQAQETASLFDRERMVRPSNPPSEASPIQDSYPSEKYPTLPEHGY